MPFLRIHVELRVKGRLRVNAGKKVRIIQHGFIIFDRDGANSQGETPDGAPEDLKEAVQLIFETNRQLAEESLAGEDVIREPLVMPIS